jgi:seryl-tRNA synthetase
MDTKPQADELERLEAINRELCQKIVDLEAEIERKHKAVEGFMAENEALKEELGGGRRGTASDEGGQVDELTARVERWRKSINGAK